MCIVLVGIFERPEAVGDSLAPRVAQTTYDVSVETLTRVHLEVQTLCVGVGGEQVKCEYVVWRVGGRTG